MERARSKREVTDQSVAEIASRIRPAQRLSLPGEIVNQLLELFAAGQAPEQQLPTEQVLCERLGVSRASLREALFALTHLGILKARGKEKYGSVVGARVQLATRSQSYHQELIVHPLEVRRLLEPEIAALAAERGDDEALAMVDRCLDVMKNAPRSSRSIVESDSAFHAAIARACRNPTMVHLVAALADSVAVSREVSFQPELAIRIALDGHQKILDALHARDPQRARASMREHLNDVETLVRASLAGGQ